MTRHTVLCGYLVPALVALAAAVFVTAADAGESFACGMSHGGMMETS
jgi:hypothetical protein